MAFVYKILFFLATSFALLSKSTGAKSMDASQYQEEADEIRSPIRRLTKDQATAASRNNDNSNNADLWQTFEVAATDPELTDPSNVKPTLDPETLIDWYFHAADMKTKLDRQSNDLSPKYVPADRNDRPVMNFDSTNVPLKMNHKLFKYDDLPEVSSRQSTEQSSTSSDLPSSGSSETEQPLVTDYGARRTNDASMWYLRRFKSSEDSPAEAQHTPNHNEPILPSPSHHWPGSINQNDEHRQQSQPQQYDDHRSHRHLHHHGYPIDERQQQPQQYSGSPLDNQAGFHLSKASSDHQYNKNNGDPSSIFKEASAVSTWEEQFPISAEFDSAFNSVVAGGDPIQHGKVKASGSHQLSQVNGQTRRPPIVDSFKYDYESASGPATSHHTDSGASPNPLASPQRPQSKSMHARPPTVNPNMYDPPGFPRRFYRLQL